MMRKLAIAAALLLAVVGAVLLFGRGWLAETAFKRGVDASAGIDQSASFADGLHVYVCGSGSPMPDAARAGPCLGVLAGNQAFVFDAGSGSIRKLQRMGFPMTRAEAAFLTHLHSDHIDGLGELLLQAWVAGGRSAPLPVHGPPGTQRVIDGLRTAYEIDRGYRVAHHGPDVVNPAGFGGRALEINLNDAGSDSDGVVYAEKGVTIRVFAVDHNPISPAYGYRIDYKGRSVVISGDTVYSPSLVTAAKGADLLLHEALNKPMVAAMGRKLAERGQTRTAQIMTDIQNYHASPEDAARAAKEAGVRALVLYHLVPAPPARLIEPLFLGKAPQIFEGTLRLADDGMLIHLPGANTAVQFESAF